MDIEEAKALLRQERLEKEAERARRRAAGEMDKGWCSGGIAAGSNGAHWMNRASCPTCGKTVRLHSSGKTYRHKLPQA